MLVRELIHNLTVLVSIALVYDLLGLFSAKESLRRQLIAGGLFGLAAVLAMVAPLKFTDGVIFDGRSIILAISGLFAGLPGATVTAVAAAGYRTYVGGDGMWAGLAVIVTSAGLGTIAYYLRKRHPWVTSLPALWALGLVVHFVMLLFQVTLLPTEIVPRVVKTTGPIVVLVFPAAFVLIARLFIDREIKERTAAEHKAIGEMYKNLFYNTHSVMLLIDPVDGRIIDASPAAATFYGWDRKALCSMRVADIVILPQDCGEAAAPKGTQAGHSERRHRRADGSVRDVAVTSGTVQVSDKPLLHTIVSDITDLKQAERRVELALEERESLLKEIHHRVKNNLAVIASLISLQAGRSSRPRDAVDALLKTRDRINAIAAVHNAIYRAGNLSRLDFYAFLPKLLANLKYLHANRPSTTLSLSGRRIDLDVDLAVPLALIATELVSNALKHAFPDEQDGSVEVSIAARGDSAGEDGAVQLTVVDDGIGFSEDSISRHESLGLQLVRVLVQQIDGSLEFIHADGTTAEVTFPTTIAKRNRKPILS
jgi:PAS domain S-box-containing protein